MVALDEHESEKMSTTNTVSCDEMSLGELLRLTAEELETVEEFDAGLDVVRGALFDGEQLEMWWRERERRIVAAQRAALAEEEALWLDDAAAPVERMRVELPAFAWDVIGGHDDLDALAVEEIGADMIAVWLTREQAERAGASMSNAWEEVGEGTWAEETAGETWEACIARQDAALARGVRALAELYA